MVEVNLSAVTVISSSPGTPWWRKRRPVAVVVASVAAAASVAEAGVVQHGAASNAQQRMKFTREPDSDSTLIDPIIFRPLLVVIVRLACSKTYHRGKSWQAFSAACEAGQSLTVARTRRPLALHGTRPACTISGHRRMLRRIVTAQALAAARSGLIDTSEATASPGLAGSWRKRHAAATRDRGRRPLRPDQMSASPARAGHDRLPPVRAPVALSSAPTPLRSTH